MCDMYNLQGSREFGHLQRVFPAPHRGGDAPSGAAGPTEDQESAATGAWLIKNCKMLCPRGVK